MLCKLFTFFGKFLRKGSRFGRFPTPHLLVLKIESDITEANGQISVNFRTYFSAKKKIEKNDIELTRQGWGADATTNLLVLISPIFSRITSNYLQNQNHQE